MELNDECRDMTPGVPSTANCRGTSFSPSISCPLLWGARDLRPRGDCGVLARGGWAWDCDDWGAWERGELWDLGLGSLLALFPSSSQLSEERESAREKVAGVPSVAHMRTWSPEPSSRAGRGDILVPPTFTAGVTLATGTGRWCGECRGEARGGPAGVGAP